MQTVAALAPLGRSPRRERRHHAFVLSAPPRPAARSDAHIQGATAPSQNATPMRGRISMPLWLAALIFTLQGDTASVAVVCELVGTDGCQQRSRHTFLGTAGAVRSSERR